MPSLFRYLDVWCEAGLILFIRACLYGAGLARVPGLTRFAEISTPQKIPQHYLQCLILRLWEILASPVRRDHAFVYPRSRVTGLIFLHINSAARAGSRADIIYNINFKRALVHSLNLKQDGVEKEADKQVIARRRSNLALAYKDTLAITIIVLCNCPLKHCLNSWRQRLITGACNQRTRYVYVWGLNFHSSKNMNEWKLAFVSMHLFIFDLKKA